VGIVEYRLLGIKGLHNKMVTECRCCEMWGLSNAGVAKCGLRGIGKLGRLDILLNKKLNYLSYLLSI
jgi:hypothetical protein